MQQFHDFSVFHRATPPHRFLECIFISHSECCSWSHVSYAVTQKVVPSDLSTSSAQAHPAGGILLFDIQQFVLSTSILGLPVSAYFINVLYRRGLRRWTFPVAKGGWPLPSRLLSPLCSPFRRDASLVEVLSLLVRSHGLGGASLNLVRRLRMAIVDDNV